MRKSSWAALALAFILFGSMSAMGRCDDEEVHIVSIYEGFEQTGNMIHGPKAIVKIDRPGKQVTLVLTSHSGATWYLSVTKETSIQRIILGGDRKQAVEGVDESTEITKLWRGESKTPLSYFHKPAGTRFRKFIKQITALTDANISSFHGAYNSSAESPFLIEPPSKPLKDSE